MRRRWRLRHQPSAPPLTAVAFREEPSLAYEREPRSYNKVREGNKGRKAAKSSKHAEIVGLGECAEQNIERKEGVFFFSLERPSDE